MTVQTVAARRRDKAIAIILRHKEDLLDEFVPEERSDAFRRVVLDQINDLHELFVDLLEASQGTLVNDRWLDLLEEVHAAVTEPEDEPG